MHQIRHVSQLMDLHDREFVEAVYRTILGREADEAGLSFYVGRLRTGAGRPLVLAELWRSKEARAVQAQVEGLEDLVRDAERARQRRLLSLGGRGPESAINRVENELGRTSHKVDRIAPQVNHCVVRIDELRNDMDRLLGTLAWGGRPAPVVFRQAQVHEADAEAVAALPEQARALLLQLGVSPRGGGEQG